MAGRHKQSLSVVVSSMRDEGCDAKSFRLEWPEGARFDFRPGQFLLVGFPGEKKKNAYSIGSSPLETGYAEITVAPGSGISSRLFALNGGETLEIEGPLGSFTYDDEHRSAVLVSEGVGITPFRSMIRYVLDKGLPNKLALFYAERKPSCLLFRDDLDDFAKNGVVVHATVAERPEGELWDGPMGAVDLDAIASKVPDYKSSVFYVCGRNKVVDAVVEPLKKAKIPPERIRAEKWGEW